MICTPFTGPVQRPVKGVHIMRYTYEYKRKCVELYREGQWPETPEGIKERNFLITVRRRVRLEGSQGPEV